MIIVHALSAFHPALKGVIRDIRTVWTLEELGLPYERRVMDPLTREHKSPAFRALNPFGKVPVIQDGDFTLFESAAICAYLGDKAGKLIPKAGTRERALHDQWVAFATTTLEPQMTKLFGFDHFTEKDATVARLREENLAVIDGMLGVLDGELAKRPYVAGEEFAIADIVLSSVCRFVEHTGVLTKHERLGAYLNGNYARPAFAKALAANG